MPGRGGGHYTSSCPATRDCGVLLARRKVPVGMNLFLAEPCRMEALHQPDEKSAPQAPTYHRRDSASWEPTG
ncbi:hypothetical protein FKM82_030099 [Ascaphus truei]